MITQKSHTRVGTFSPSRENTSIQNSPESRPDSYANMTGMESYLLESDSRLYGLPKPVRILPTGPDQ